MTFSPTRIIFGFWQGNFILRVKLGLRFLFFKNEKQGLNLTKVPGIKKQRSHCPKSVIGG